MTAHFVERFFFAGGGGFILKQLRNVRGCLQRIITILGRKKYFWFDIIISLLPFCFCHQSSHLSEEP